MHKSTTTCNTTIGKWCKNKHGASKIIDTFETYQGSASSAAREQTEKEKGVGISAMPQRGCRRRLELLQRPPRARDRHRDGTEENAARVTGDPVGAVMIQREWRWTVGFNPTASSEAALAPAGWRAAKAGPAGWAADSKCRIVRSACA
jgi:hypothetical protein